MRRYMPRWRGENREHWTAYLRKRYAVLPRDKLRAIAARYRANSRYSRALVPGALRLASDPFGPLIKTAGVWSRL